MSDTVTVNSNTGIVVKSKVPTTSIPTLKAFYDAATNEIYSYWFSSTFQTFKLFYDHIQNILIAGNDVEDFFNGIIESWESDNNCDDAEKSILYTTDMRLYAKAIKANLNDILGEKI